MPLAIICGIPCSGKTSVSEMLRCKIERDYPNFQVCIINDESLNLSKQTGYEDSAEEKKSRATFLAAVERSIAKNTVVIADGMNYIKGLRYQLYCIARAASTPHCIVHVFCSLDEAQRRNALRADAYSTSTLHELASRLEEPLSSTKWDNPLFFIDLSLSSIEMFDDSMAQIVTALCQSSVKKQPSFATSAKTAAASGDILRELDRHTGLIVDQIVASMRPFGPSTISIQGLDALQLDKPLPLKDLTDLRRQFIHINRLHQMDADRIRALFMKYISDNVNAKK